MRYCYIVERLIEKEWTDIPIDRRMAVYSSKKRAIAQYEIEKAKILQKIHGEEEEWDIQISSLSDRLCRFFIIRSKEGNARDRVSINKIQLQ